MTFDVAKMKAKKEKFHFKFWLTGQSKGKPSIRDEMKMKPNRCDVELFI